VHATFWWENLNEKANSKIHAVVGDNNKINLTKIW
jgi:hypothetical protein